MRHRRWGAVSRWRRRERKLAGELKFAIEGATQARAGGSRSPDLPLRSRVSTCGRADALSALHSSVSCMRPRHTRAG